MRPTCDFPGMKWELVEDKPILTKEDLDFSSELFGLKVVKRVGAHDLIELYVEDDDNYHYKFSFDSSWLSDLRLITTLAINEANRFSNQSKNA